MECEQWVSEHEGDLTAKLYYAKHKMVWEVLGGALKSKIEIQWSDITAIRAIIRDNVSGILQIEVNPFCINLFSRFQRYQGS